MGLSTFIGGVHPYEGKELSADKPIQVIQPKGELVYPLSQHIGAPAPRVTRSWLARRSLKQAASFPQMLSVPYPVQ
jgi:hypothetical protein